MTVPVNLALQGGGSHGAFAWGVLDGLLEDGRITFSAISGTSAGAMNAVALADGWARGGADGARERLAAFWTAVGEKARYSPLQRTPLDILLGRWGVDDNPLLLWFEGLSRTVSPRTANPLGFNPLRDVVEAEIDFERVRACTDIDVLVSATNVETGAGKVFARDELTIDHIMASACLPTLFPAVTIDGVPYWDGGYAGNPAIWPFFAANRVEDVLLVQINPILRKGEPRTAREIQNRINEITFNAGLLRELRAIAFVKRLIAAGRLERSEYRDIRLHRIDADEALADLSAASKLSAEPAFITYLHDLGRAAASDWLEGDAGQVGKAATIDLAAALDGLPDIARRGPGRHVRDMMDRFAKTA